MNNFDSFNIETLANFIDILKNCEDYKCENECPCYDYCHSIRVDYITTKEWLSKECKNDTTNTSL